MDNNTQTIKNGLEGLMSALTSVGIDYDICLGAIFGFVLNTVVLRHGEKHLNDMIEIAKKSMSESDGIISTKLH